MTVQLDADLPEVQVSSVVPASTTTVLETILTTTGPFPLVSGQILHVSAEVLGIDANGGAIYVRGMEAVILGGSPPTKLTYNSSPPYVLAESDTSNGYSGGGFNINGSGDLELGWNNVSSEAQSVSVRIKQRLVLVS